jgi:hypothetical protein
MDLSLDNLKKSKAFTSRPVEKTITWKKDGEVHIFTTFVRPLSYQTAVGDIATHRGADPLASRIAASICDATGKAIFKVSDVTGEVVLPADWKEGDPIPESKGALDPDLTNLLLIAIGEVQNVGKKPS